MNKIPTKKKEKKGEEKKKGSAPSLSPKKRPTVPQNALKTPFPSQEEADDGEDDLGDDDYSTLGEAAVGKERKVPSPYKPGRKEKSISWEKFEAGCALLATQEEIAGLLGITPHELSKRAQAHYGKSMKEIYESFSHQARMGIRRSQIKLARRNAAMAIWLGKVILGQRENESKDSKSGEVLDAMHLFLLSKNEEMNKQKKPKDAV